MNEVEITKQSTAFFIVKICYISFYSSLTVHKSYLFFCKYRTNLQKEQKLIKLPNTITVDQRPFLLTVWALVRD
jgi:hypothetical protein